MNDVRRCGRCGESKPLDAFAWRRIERGQRDNYCRPCRAAYKQEHYRANRQRYIDQARSAKAALRLERSIIILDYLVAHPCADCGETDPVVLEFDHLRDKAFNISEKLADFAWPTIEAEIAKCEVVCANCHRRRTTSRRPSMRLQLLLADEQR